MDEPKEWRVTAGELQIRDDDGWRPSWPDESALVVEQLRAALRPFAEAYRAGVFDDGRVRVQHFARAAELVTEKQV